MSEFQKDVNLHGKTRGGLDSVAFGRREASRCDISGLLSNTVLWFEDLSLEFGGEALFGHSWWHEKCSRCTASGSARNWVRKLSDIAVLVVANEGELAAGDDGEAADKRKHRPNQQYAAFWRQANGRDDDLDVPGLQ
ncbi:hypothetical protein K438DRAFT_1756084 [Mycena galopus ATCC 62051]|nr:hypothetical protein K438DRAFT_1756084 [Mycena galopus ATCC 62051]